MELQPPTLPLTRTRRERWRFLGSYLLTLLTVGTVALLYFRLPLVFCVVFYACLAWFLWNCWTAHCSYVNDRERSAEEIRQEVRAKRRI